MNKIPSGVWYGLLLGLFAVFLFVTIGRSSVWHDEGYTSILISYAPAEIIERTAADVHPPLYYLVLKGWVQVFGPTIVSLRALSAVCMLAAVGLLGWYLRRRLPAQLALAGMAGLVLSPYLIRYGQEARMYGLGTLLVVVLAIAFFEQVLSPKRMIWTVIHTLALSAALYTQYFLGLILIGFGLVLYIYHAQRIQDYRPSRVIYRIWRIERWWFASIALAGLAFLPWAPVALAQVLGVQSGFWIAPLSVLTLPNVVTQLILLRPAADFSGWWIGLAIGLIAAIVLIGYGIWKRRPALAQPASLLPLIICGPILALVVLSLPPFQPLFHPRYLIAASIFTYASLGIVVFGRQVLPSTWPYMLARLVVGLSLLVGVGQVAIRGNTFDWPSADYFSMGTFARQIKLEAEPGDVVISSGLWTYFDARHHLEIEEQVSDSLHPYLYSSVKPVYGFGNGSAIYGRDDILVYDENLCTLGNPGMAVWVIDEQVPAIKKLPSTWFNLQDYRQGYARLEKYQISQSEDCELVPRP